MNRPHKKRKFSEYRFFTTGKIAQLCGVSIATVQKWIDAGKMQVFVLPGASKERRVPREALERFLEAHGIPFDREEVM